MDDRSDARGPGPHSVSFLDWSVNPWVKLDGMMTRSVPTNCFITTRSRNSGGSRRMMNRCPVFVLVEDVERQTLVFDATENVDEKLVHQRSQLLKRGSVSINWVTHWMREILWPVVLFNSGCQPHTPPWGKSNG